MSFASLNLGTGREHAHPQGALVPQTTSISLKHGYAAGPPTSHVDIYWALRAEGLQSLSQRPGAV